MSGVMMGALGSLGGSGGLTVTISPPSPNRAAYGFTSGEVGPATANVAGGTPTTFLWTVVEEDLNYFPLTITDPTLATTSFDFGSVGWHETAVARVRCTVDGGPWAEATVTFVENDPGPAP